MGIDPNVSDDPKRAFEAVLASVLRAEEANTPVDAEPLIASHPEFAEELRSFFHNRDALGKLIEPFRTELWPAVPGSCGDAATPGSAQRIRYFGDYELLEELGRGGMGVVYKAKQRSLNRTVAVKLILAGALASPQDVERFRREADAAASLDHPNITPIFEVGEHDGQHFYSMRFVEGKTLTECLSGIKGDHRRIARLMAVLSRAVHHAHQRGILHRDLKPANILIDVCDQPQITDFGLARRVEGDSELTESGAVIGTPSYMSPEQARGMRLLTTSVDIYSLGAIFFHALTGRPPFTGSSPLDVLRQVAETDAPRPSVKYAGVDRDLEAICLKCLEAEPSRRYDSAAALADDLERWLRHEPVEARTSGPLRRMGKWVRRHPAATTMMCLAAIAIATIAWQWRVASTASNRAERELYRNQLALADRDIAADNVLSARRWLLDVAEEKRGWEWKSLWQSSYVTSDNRLPEQPSPLLDAHVLSEQGQLATLQYDGAVQIWDLKTLRLLHQWSAWDKPKEYFGSHCHAFSKDGRILAFGNEGRSDIQTTRAPVLTVTNLQTGEVLFTEERRALALAFNSDGSVLYALCESSLYPGTHLVAWNLAAGERLFEFERAIDPHLSADGERLIVTSDGEKLYDLAGRRVYSAWDGKEMEEISFESSEFVNEGYASPLAMSADERMCAWARDPHRSAGLLLQEITTGKSREIKLRTASAVTCAAFSNDGRVIAAAVQELNVDLAEMKLNDAVPFLGPLMGLEKKSQYYGYRVCIYDVRDGRLIRSLRGFPGRIYGLAFCNNDQLLVRVGGEFADEASITKAHGDALLWDISESGSGRLLAKLGESVCNISISADSTLLAAGCTDGMAYVWNLRAGEQIHALKRRSDGEPVFAVFGPNTGLLAVSGERKLSRFDAVSGDEKWSVSIDSWDLGRVAWTPDGRSVAIVTADGTKFFYAASGQFDRNAENRGPVVYSQDGRFTAWPQMHDLHGELIVLDQKSGSELFRAKTETALAAFSTGYGFVDAAFSPDGKVVVAVGNNGPGIAFSSSSGRPLYELQGRDGTFCSVDFSPDGTRIATGGLDGAIRIWDAATGEELHAFRGHDRAVNDVAFNPDGTKLVSGGHDGRIKVWEAPQ